MKRSRLWEHQEGIYATSVFIPIPASAALMSLQRRACRMANVSWGEAAHVEATSDLHVSLSRTLPVPRELRHRLATRLGAILSSAGARFFITVDEELGLQSLVNETRSTTFVAAVVQADELGPLVRRMDSVLQALGLPCYPDPPVFHISLGCAAGDFAGLPLDIPTGSNSDNDDDDDDANGFEFVAREGVIRIGKTEHVFVLPEEEF